MAVQPFFLSPLVYQLEGFRQVTALQIIQHLFSSYGVINGINLKENVVKMIRPYNLTKPYSDSSSNYKKGESFHKKEVSQFLTQ